MNHKQALTLLISATILLLAFTLPQTTTAQQNQTAPTLTLEHEQHWETYQKAGTCIFATQNIALSDLDADGTTEIITGGFTYQLENETRANASAPLKIWNYENQNLTLETAYTWPDTQNSSAAIVAVTTSDINQDGTTNLLTAGSLHNQTGTYAQLRIWTWNGTNLTLKTSHELNNNTYITSTTIIDADQDGTKEIFTAGRTQNPETNQTDAQLTVWHWNNTELTRLNSTQWHNGTEAQVNSICAADLNNDAQIDIITAGYNHELTNSTAQLRIWTWNGKNLQLQANTEWQTAENTYALNTAGGIQGNTVLNNVKTADVDNDGTPEIVTGGFTYNGENINAQLRIWNYTQQTLNLEKSYQWTTNYLTEIKSLTLNDVDNDGNIEIITSGTTAAQNSFDQNNTAPETAQLKIFAWNTTDLTEKQTQEWSVGEGVCAWNVASGDIDKDGTVEIITVGCMYVTNLCDPDMRIWSITAPAPTETPTTETMSPGWQTELFIAAAGSISVIALATSYLLWKRNRKKRT